MDRTLLLLLIVSGLLLAMLVPHATLMLTAIILLSFVTTRIFWAVVQSFGEEPYPRRAID